MSGVSGLTSFIVPAVTARRLVFSVSFFVGGAFRADGPGSIGAGSPPDMNPANVPATPAAGQGS